MPWGWECRQKLIKQNPAKPTERKGRISGECSTPGPTQYEQSELYCGKGYSKIKRAPAYTFGHLTKWSFSKPATSGRAPQLDVSGTGPRGGRYRIPGSVISPRLEPPGGKFQVPGPGAYEDRSKIRCKRAPAYGMRLAAKPPYEPWDQWTAPPNMYYPPIPRQNPPSYTLGYKVRDLKKSAFPGPGEHNPKFDYVKKTKPAFSFGSPFKPIKPHVSPSPNTYCEKKFMVKKPTSPAPSFGIRHSPYVGKRAEYIKPPDLKPMISGES